jgi:hypothetical protein
MVALPARIMFINVPYLPSGLGQVSSEDVTKVSSVLANILKHFDMWIQEPPGQGEMLFTKLLFD